MPLTFVSLTPHLNIALAHIIEWGFTPAVEADEGRNVIYVMTTERYHNSATEERNRTHVLYDDAAMHLRALLLRATAS